MNIKYCIVRQQQQTSKQKKRYCQKVLVYWLFAEMVDSVVFIGIEHRKSTVLSPRKMYRNYLERLIFVWDTNPRISNPSPSSLHSWFRGSEANSIYSQVMPLPSEGEWIPKSYNPIGKCQLEWSHLVSFSHAVFVKWDTPLHLGYSWWFDNIHLRQRKKLK